MVFAISTISLWWQAMHSEYFHKKSIFQSAIHCFQLEHNYHVNKDGLNEWNLTSKIETHYFCFNNLKNISLKCFLNHNGIV